MLPLSIALFCIVLVFYVFFSANRVSGDSMEPTLRDQDLLLLSKSYREPARGDIVVFRLQNEDGTVEGLIKRVVAVPGDTVTVRDGVATVNGERESTPSFIPSPGERASAQPVVVPAGHVYVLGDNRPVALDSRDLGPIPLTAIRGRVAARFAPVNRAGFVR
jgi:signal peptidase I